MGRQVRVRLVGLALIATLGSCAGDPDWVSLLERDQGEDAGVTFLDASEADGSARGDAAVADHIDPWRVATDAVAGGAESMVDADDAREDAADNKDSVDGGAGGDTADTGVAGDASIPRPTSGGLIITEIMSDPEVGAERHGEWIELYYAGPQQLVSLKGCELRDAGRDVHLIEDEVLVHRGSYVVLAASERTDALGFTPDYVYSNFVLANGEDEVRLTCGGELVDEVIYGAQGPTPRAGVSLSLDPCQTGTMSNDRPESWCEPYHVYNPPEAEEGDRATPGQGNAPCATAH